MDLSEPGLGDFVLLGQITEEAFMDNLRQRFVNDRIYVRGAFRAFFFGIVAHQWHARHVDLYR